MSVDAAIDYRAALHAMLTQLELLEMLTDTKRRHRTVTHTHVRV